MRRVLLMVFVVFAMVAASPFGVMGEQAAAPPERSHSGHDHGAMDTMKGKAPGDPHHHMMMEQCREMQAKMEKAKADIKAMDERLEKKLAAMDAAKGEKKVEAMAAVIRELVSQRKEMRDKMDDVHHGKMCGMMAGKMMGMPPGAMNGGGEMGSMQECPMMQKGPGMKPQDNEEKMKDAEEKQEEAPAKAKEGSN